MITKASNQVILTQLANLFYPSNNIGKSSLIGRLNLYLDDTLFESILSQISYGQYYWYKITNVTVDAIHGVIHLKTQFGDLFRGGSSIGEIRDVSLSKINDWRFIYNKVSLVYLGETVQSNSVHVQIVQNANAEGYGITYDPLGGTQGGSGTGGSGTVTVTPLPSPPQKEITTQTSSIFGNLDLNSFLLPGVILLAGYFLIKK